MDRWRYATLVLEQEAHDVTWIVTAVDCDPADGLEETLVGQQLYRADILNIAGSLGFEAYSVHVDEEASGTVVETFYMRVRQ